MTEEWIRQTAENFGLKVLKRVTTGTEKSGFATFEITGEEFQLFAAWECFKDRASEENWPWCRLTHVDVKDHPNYGRPFIQIESVWFEKS